MVRNYTQQLNDLDNMAKQWVRSCHELDTKLEIKQRFDKWKDDCLSLDARLSECDNTSDCTDDDGYTSWSDVPDECPACESGIDVGKYHTIIVNGEPCSHPNCCITQNNSHDDDSSIIDNAILDSWRYDKYVLGIPFSQQRDIKIWSKEKNIKMKGL